MFQNLGKKVSALAVVALCIWFKQTFGWVNFLEGWFVMGVLSPIIFFETVVACCDPVLGAFLQVVLGPIYPVIHAWESFDKHKLKKALEAEKRKEEAK